MRSLVTLANGKADKKLEKMFCFVVLRQYTRKFAFRAPAWARN